MERSQGETNKIKPGASEHEEIVVGSMEILEPNSSAG
jgi:hypothetical protein